MAWYILILIYLIVSLIALFILFLIAKKLMKLKKYKIKRKKNQITEILDNKVFVNSNGERFKFYSSKFNANKNKIYLFVHGIFGLSDFAKNYIRTSSENLISFVQRGYDETEQHQLLNKSLPDALLDIEELIVYYKNKFPKKEIILIGEGFSCALVFRLKDLVNEIIMLNPILDISRLNLPKGKIFGLHVPLLVPLFTRIKLNVDYDLLTKNKSLAIKSKNNNTKIYFNFLYLYQLIRSIKKFKILLSETKKVIVFQSEYSFFYNEYMISKKLRGIEAIKFLPTRTQLLSTTNDFDHIWINEKGEFNV